MYDYVYMTFRLNYLSVYRYELDSGYIGNTGRVTEARLGRELSEKKIIDFTLREGGFDITKLSSITKPPSKVWVCVCV